MNNVNNTEIMNNVNNTGPIMSTGLPKKCGLLSCVAGMWLSPGLDPGEHQAGGEHLQGGGPIQRSPKILNIYN